MLAAILGLTSEWRYAQDRARWQYLDLVETAVLHADDDGDTGKHLWSKQTDVCHRSTTNACFSENRCSLKAVCNLHHPSISLVSFIPSTRSSSPSFHFAHVISSLVLFGLLLTVNGVVFHFFEIPISSWSFC